MDKNTKMIVGAVIAIVVLWGGYALMGKQSVPATNEPIKIGVATFLSGDLAALGENIVNTAQLAVDDINAKGGINGRQIQIIAEDAKCDSKTGLSAVSKLVNTDNVKYIVGGMCSNGTIAAAPVANEHNVVLMTPVTGGRNVDEAGEYIFRTANSDLLAGRNIAEAMAKKGYKKVGVIAETTEYTIDIKKSFEQRANELGLTVAVAEEFQPNTTDFRTIAAKIKGENLEAVLVASQTGISGGNLIKQMKSLGINAPVFSDFLLVLNGDVKKILGSFEGIYFADPSYNADNAGLKDFLAAYKVKYGKEPVVPFHSAATYDDVQLLATAIKAVGDDSVKVHDWLKANVKSYKGFMGTYSIDQNGNSDLGFTVKVVKEGVATGI
ncbi:MAG: Extracellular ligand-binding receptor [Candidatus Wolfebacteria bacterium GW2011_GWC2_39_22]|uniref:Extracellular ligand-binding receptor n=1 Tax=Candidatus Wolfebacteria bacterium GW2011_GWC2_39_22 TaxID=1619013 RepID=A0A0G0N9Y6_9BACT|nr:MAG: Extracellular ligand-binding receptor [Candidatus Wolfebacteria bacterium GW2011_GWC2_39_22]HBI25900.1 hypothetical protein [Candidatus Wolfebacteria bacterium]